VSENDEAEDTFSLGSGGATNATGAEDRFCLCF